jgi:Peptidase family M1 domain
MPGNQLFRAASPTLKSPFNPLWLPRTLSIAAVALATSLPGIAADSVATNSPNGAPLSQRVVAYVVDAKLDTNAKTLDATETLEYKNLTGRPLDSFPFHLYLNAFRPESSFSYEAHANGSVRAVENSYPQEKIGGIDIKAISAEGFGDLSRSWTFIAPDDGNAADHTVMLVKLNRPVAPNETIRFHIAFHDKFPISIARNGWKRDFIMGGQWFPKVGVFWKKSTDPQGAWNCHQYHATTEFFADFGTFDVTLNVPQRYVVGASGVSTGEQAKADGTKTLSFHGEDIHDFAWAASPNFQAADRTFQSSMGPVKLHALVLKAHAGQTQRYLDILEHSMQKFDQWYGPFPYKQMTLIDPEPGSEMYGMEYPTLITAGTFWGVPDKIYLNEIITEHEFGHQYWYGMVATNEFEEAWLDEGINSYTEVKVLDSLLGKESSFVGYAGLHLGDAVDQRLNYIGTADYDPMTRFAWKFYSGNSYARVTYGKTATVLNMLESFVGEDTVRLALHTYFMRYRFTHPTGEDFLRTVEEVAAANGKNSNLRPSFNQAVSGTQILDYEVKAADSEPVVWWKDPGKHYQGEYRTVVSLHRKGDFIFPVTTEMKFDDGSTIRENWDGVDRWTRYTYVKKAQLLSAEIDPQHQVWLDKDFFNNSYVVASHGAASLKLSSYWVIAQELMAHFAAWIV